MIVDCWRGNATARLQVRYIVLSHVAVVGSRGDVERLDRLLERRAHTAAHLLLLRGLVWRILVQGVAHRRNRDPTMVKVHSNLRWTK